MHWMQNIGPAILISIWQSAIAYVLLFALRKWKITKPNQTYIMGLGLQIVLMVLFFINVVSSPTESTRQSNTNNITSTFSNILSSNYISYTYVILLLLNSIFLFGKSFYNKGKINKQYLTTNHTIPFEIKDLMARLKKTMGIERPVRIYLNESIITPFTKGFLKPSIILPLSFINGLNFNQMEAVLIHELSHIKRWDYPFLTLQLFMERIMYFNPFFLQIGKSINEDRELCCDIKSILLSSLNSVSYIETLLFFTKNKTTNKSLELALTGKENSELLHRATYVLEGKKINDRRHSFALNMMAILAFGSQFFFLPATKVEQKLAPLRTVNSQRKPILESKVQKEITLPSISEKKPSNTIVNKYIVKNTYNKNKRKLHTATFKKTLQNPTEESENIASLNIVNTKPSFTKLVAYIQPSGTLSNSNFKTLEISDNKALFAFQVKDPNASDEAFNRIIHTIHNRFAIESSAFQYMAFKDNDQIVESYSTELKSTDYRFLLIKGKRTIYLAIAARENPNS